MLGAMVRTGTGCREPMALGVARGPRPARLEWRSTVPVSTGRAAPGKGKLLDAAARRLARRALGLGHRPDTPQGDAVTFCNRRELPQEHAGSRRPVDGPRVLPPAWGGRQA